MKASGDLYPIASSYADAAGGGRMVSDLFVRATDRWKIQDPVRLAAFDLEHYGWHCDGRGDVAARLAEVRWDDAEPDDRPHPWDEPEIRVPVRLPYGGR